MKDKEAAKAKADAEAATAAGRRRRRLMRYLKNGKTPSKKNSLLSSMYTGVRRFLAAAPGPSAEEKEDARILKEAADKNALDEYNACKLHTKLVKVGSSAGSASGMMIFYAV